MGKIKENKLDIELVNKVLDEEIFGKSKVKKRILEFIECERFKGKILCLIGPSGVGKSAVVKAVAKALDKHVCLIFRRKFYIFEHELASGK